MKLEFINRDCGLVATAELIGERWFIEIEATQTLNTLAKDSEADVLEWALQHGFKKRKAASLAPVPLETIVRNLVRRAAQD